MSKFNFKKSLNLQLFRSASWQWKFCPKISWLMFFFLTDNDRMQNILETTCGAKHTPTKNFQWNKKNTFLLQMVNVLNFLKKLLLLILAIFDIIFMNCIFSSAKDIYLNFRIKHVLSIFYQPDNYMTSHDVPFEFYWH